MTDDGIDDMTEDEDEPARDLGGYRFAVNRQRRRWLGLRDDFVALLGEDEANKVDAEFELALQTTTFENDEAGWMSIDSFDDALTKFEALISGTEMERGLQALRIASKAPMEVRKGKVIVAFPQPSEKIMPAPPGNHVLKTTLQTMSAIFPNLMASIEAVRTTAAYELTPEQKAEVDGLVGHLQKAVEAADAIQKWSDE